MRSVSTKHGTQAGSLQDAQSGSSDSSAQAGVKMGAGKRPKRRRGWMPTSLFGRAMLIVVLPTLLLQGMVSVFFYERHWDNVRRHMAIALANEIHYIVRRAEAASTRQSSLQMASKFFGLSAEWEPGAHPLEPFEAGRSEFPQLQEQLRVRVPYPLHVAAVEGDSIEVAIAMPTGLLRIVTSEKRVTSATTWIFLLVTSSAAVVFCAVAVLFLRNQIRPIQQLALAAEAFGKGQEIDGFRPRGASEVRRAGQAFLLMSERIRRQITKRTQMLAAISHDLRTPLTRMKLQIAMMDGAAVEGIGQDIREMEAMIDEYLQFVRGEGTERAQRVALPGWLEELVAGYVRQGAKVRMEPGPEVEIPLREQAMRRCLHNLISNALRYAEHVEVGYSLSEEQVQVWVDDDGPGIPEAHRKEMFQPFRRLEQARTLGDGGHVGVGLGLAIAKDIVLGHGGSIELEDAPMGGLRVRLQLPL